MENHPIWTSKCIEWFYSLKFRVRDVIIFNQVQFVYILHKKIVGILKLVHFNIESHQRLHTIFIYTIFFSLCVYLMKYVDRERWMDGWIDRCGERSLDDEFTRPSKCSLAFDHVIEPCMSHAYILSEYIVNLHCLWYLVSCILTHGLN